jgi:hypothetical protein
MTTPTPGPLTSAEGLPVRDDLRSVCDEIFGRWDKDMRSGKLLTALAGRLPGYDPRVTRILAALENEHEASGSLPIIEAASDKLDGYERSECTQSSPAPVAEGGEAVAWRWRWTNEALGVAPSVTPPWQYSETGDLGNGALKVIQPLYRHPPSAAGREIAEALEPFAALARLRYPDEGGAPSWIDIMTKGGEHDEIELRSHVAADRASLILYGDDFRRADAILDRLQSNGGG